MIGPRLYIIGGKGGGDANIIYFYPFTNYLFYHTFWLDYLLSTVSSSIHNPNPNVAHHIDRKSKQTKAKPKVPWHDG